MTTLLHFTIIHPLVDACSVSVLVAGGMTWERVIAYNAMAISQTGTLTAPPFCIR